MRTLTLLLAPLFATPALAAETHELQPLGLQHAWQTVATDGDPWLALVGDRHGHRLVDTRVEVEPVAGLFGTDAVGEPDGRMITVPGPEPMMLMRGPGLVAGDVPSARRQVAGGTPLVDGDVLDLHLPGDLPARLELACHQLHAEFDDLHDYGDHLCLLVFEQGSRVQVLGQWMGSRLGVDGDSPGLDHGIDRESIVLEGGPVLLIAGDLDGDGRIDLLLELSDHYNLSLPTLWLSDEGTGGEEPLQAVAAYAQTGC